MMSDLKPCPCGQIPPSLSIQDGDTFRWKQVAGNCCQEWWIEARISDGDPQIDELAAEAWNNMTRGFEAAEAKLGEIAREVTRWEKDSIPYCEEKKYFERAGGIHFAAFNMNVILGRLGQSSKAALQEQKQPDTPVISDDKPRESVNTL